VCDSSHVESHYARAKAICCGAAHRQKEAGLGVKKEAERTRIFADNLFHLIPSSSPVFFFSSVPPHKFCNPTPRICSRNRSAIAR
jgi:hypothetical protein